MTAAITLDPDPPVHGSKCKVCIDGVTLPRTLRYRFKSNGVWSDWIEVEVGDDGTGCTNVDVPSNASRMQVEDMGGSAPVRDVPVT